MSREDESGAHFRCRVEPSDAGQRLDRVLAQRGFLPTRSRIASLVRGGHVTVDGVVRKASHAVAVGSIIDVVLPPEEPTTLEAEPIPLEILYEDEAIVAVNKPAGMATHPAPGSRRGTLVAALLAHWNFSAEWPDPQRPGIVHRLDKDTTGVIVIAKTPQAMHAIARQFSRRTVVKTYHAVVFGRPESRTGTIDLAIGRDPVHRKRMQARIGQLRPAVTSYRILAELGGVLDALPDVSASRGSVRGSRRASRLRAVASLLEVRPHTGRTHQIRVHLASIGHPIVGDVLYGAERRARETGNAHDGAVAAMASFPRQALHAASLELRHPLDGRNLVLTAPLPEDIQRLIATLRASGDRSVTIDERSEDAGAERGLDSPWWLN